LKKDYTPLLNVSNLKVVYGKDGNQVTVIDDIDYQLHRGKVLGIVGESGSGKTQSSFSLLGIESGRPGIVEGNIDFNFNRHSTSYLNKIINREIVKKNISGATQYIKNFRNWEKSISKFYRNIRGKRIFLMFQDPKSYLNPFWNIKKLFTTVIPQEIIDINGFDTIFQKSLLKFGLDNYREIEQKYPHQLSGGQIQRVMIALGYACSPDIIIADEITTGLDVVNQRIVVDNLKKLLDNVSNNHNKKLPGIILISHDIGFISKLANHILVMYAGQGLEYGTADKLLDPNYKPKHPYTSKLLNIYLGGQEYIEGDPPNISAPPVGCRFHERCDIFNKNQKLQCDQFFPKDFKDMNYYSHQIRCRLYE